MKDEEDPFLNLMRFLEGRDSRARQAAVKLDSLLEKVIHHIFMTVYLLYVGFVLLLLTAHVMLDSPDPGLRGVGAAMHVSAGILQLCHQLPYRSFIFNGIPMAVCARDVGIYLGSILGAATFALKKKPEILSRFKLPLLATVPIALDGMTQTILMVRESNNLVRVATGMIFAFGVTAYAVNRFLLRKYPLFRENVLDLRFLAADVAVVLALYYLLFTPLGSGVEREYLGRDAAVSKSLEMTALKPVAVESYYVSSRAPVSVKLDPFYTRHRDNVLDDIRNTEWALEDEDSSDDGNRTLDDVLYDVTGKTHRLGIWAVVAYSEEPVRDGSAYVAEGSGEYFYYDAYTGELIMKVEH